MDLLYLVVLFVLSGYVYWVVCDALHQAATLGGEDNGEEVDSTSDSEDESEGDFGSLREGHAQENRGGEEAGRRG